MTNRTDTDAIEDRLARNRDRLASTLDELQDRVSIDHLAREALDTVKTNAAAYTRSIDRAVRANPLALALTGVGLAWLVFGSRDGSDDDDDRRPAALPYRAAGADWPQRQDRQRGEDWSHRIDRMRDRATQSLHRIERDAADRTRAMRDGLADEAEGWRDFAAERAAVVADFAADLRDGFMHGLEDLSGEARERIAAARERAYAASLRARQAASYGARESGRMIEDHPIVAGLVAAALGAAVAAALPRTRTEDRAFGSERDRLMDEARRLWDEERDRARHVATGVAEELRQGVKSTADAVVDRVGETAEAVRDRAQEEARKDGKPGKSAGGGGKPAGAGGSSDSSSGDAGSASSGSTPPKPGGPDAGAKARVSTAPSPGSTPAKPASPPQPPRQGG